MRYTTIFLDWDGTLSACQFWQHWSQQQLQLFTRLQEYLFVERSDLVQPWMLGQLTAEQVVDQIADRLALTPDVLMRELEASCRAMRWIDPAVVSTIQQLRSVGVKVVIATDNMDTFWRWTIPALQLDRYFDAILDSASLGHVKADLDSHRIGLFFQTYLDEQGEVPAQCLLIDDSKGNLIVEQAGLNFQLTQRGQSINPLLQSLLPPDKI